MCPYPVTKSLFDKCLACFLLMICLPVFIGIILLTISTSWIWRDDRGPIFYREERMSHGEKFWLIKFRIMKQQILAELLKENGRINKIKEHERASENLTRIGKYTLKSGISMNSLSSSISSRAT